MIRGPGEHAIPPPDAFDKWFDGAWRLVQQLEIHDAITMTHTWRVVLYARALAEDAGHHRALVETISLGAALHDVGKLDIPDAILRKPARLTEEEFALVRTHTTLGEARVRALGVTDPTVLEIVRSHHERLDGSGYPDALREGEIPRPALYFSVIDSYDAMTSRRPYQPAPSEDAEARAIEELLSQRNTRYCADAVERFVRLHERGELDWIARHFNEDSTRYQTQTPGSGAMES